VKLWAVVAIVAIACGVGAVLWNKLPAHESQSRSWTIQRDDGGGGMVRGDGGSEGVKRDGGGEGVKRDGGSDAVRP
jgi:hypothetical protein